MRRNRHIIIPNTVSTIGESAFEFCRNLVSVGVNQLGLFSPAANNLSTINIPDGVTSIDAYTFWNCENLQCIEIPSSVKYIDECVFEGCQSLKTVTISSSVESIGNDSFFDCCKLSNINVSPDNKYYASIDGVLFDKSISTLIKYPEGKICEYTIPNTVRCIETRAFNWCSGLLKINIPDSVEIIRPDNLRHCIDLAEITVSDNNQYYHSIGGVLFDKSKSSLIRYPEGKNERVYTIPYSVTTIEGNAFMDCFKIFKVDIPDSVVYIKRYAFFCCSNLRSLNIPDKVKDIGERSFYMCCNIESLTIPDNTIDIGEYAFEDCFNLIGITIGKNVEYIAHNAFQGCSKVMDICINKEINRISGAPRGAIDADIKWQGEF